MKLLRLAACIATASLMTACGGGSSSSSDDVNADDSSITISAVEQVLETNADIAYAVYSDSVSTAADLQTAISNFANAVAAYKTSTITMTAAGVSTEYQAMQDALLAAKKAWLVAREPYGQSEVYRFRLSPIDSTDYTSEDGPEGDINAWPLGEALIDYVQTNTSDFDTDQIGVTANSAGINGNGAIDKTYADSNPSENIIGNTSVTIDADLLANTATADDEHDVIAGYHAIEFLLWGQDLNDSGTTTDGTDRDEAVKTEAVRDGAGTTYPFAAGGERPLSDFYETTYGDRRLAYLEVAAQKLVDDLTSVRDGWAEGADYREAFTSVADEDDALQKLTEILTGMGTLSEGELAGERMQIAFASNSQEDEHSCFSDNTHRDIAMDALGVANSYYGEYAGYDSDLDGVVDVTTNAVTDGYGLDDLLAAAGETTLAASMVSALTATRTNYEAIDAEARDGVPFDVLIMDANRDSDNPVYKTIVSLNAQSQVIAEIAEALDIDADVVDPEASECDTSNPDAEC